jgi:hypothetical protein
LKLMSWCNGVMMWCGLVQVFGETAEGLREALGRLGVTAKVTADAGQAVPGQAFVVIGERRGAHDAGGAEGSWSRDISLGWGHHMSHHMSITDGDDPDPPADF